MQNFIVLGIVPGTHIQLTFSLWLTIVASLCGALILVRLLMMLHLRNYLISRKIAGVIDNCDLVIA